MNQTILLENYPDQFYIFGKTVGGKKFRPSDWAERFCGVLSSYRPENNSTRNLNSKSLSYSPYAHPQNFKGEKVVFISKEIEKIEPLAWKFIISFINDNKLTFAEKEFKVEIDDYKSSKSKKSGEFKNC